VKVWRQYLELTDNLKDVWWIFWTMHFIDTYFIFNKFFAVNCFVIFYIRAHISCVHLHKNFCSNFISIQFRSPQN
jgi:hypothetical protein